MPIRKGVPAGEVELTNTNKKIWRAFESLARAIPDDQGVRMTVDLAKSMLVERHRLKVPVPPILVEVLQRVAK